MKAPKSVVDKTASYMDKGTSGNPSSNEPKGEDFNETLTKPAPMAGVGMSQHKKPMNKFGTRHKGPNEHMEPSHKLFESLGK